MLSYLRQTIITAWDHSLVPYQGIAHLNCPFREPLAPIFDPEIEAIYSQVIFDNFFDMYLSQAFVKLEVEYFIICSFNVPQFLCLHK